MSLLSALTPPVVFAGATSPESSVGLDTNYNYLANANLDTVANLRLTTPATATSGPPRVYVNGNQTVGDGGGGWYYYNSGDVASPDNGSTIIVAADGSRWYLEGQVAQGITAAEMTAGVTPTTYAYAELDFRRYGFKGNGTASDFSSVNSACLIAQQYTGVTLRAPPNSTIVMNQPLTSWDVSKFGIDWNGSTILWTGMTTANSIALAPFTSQVTNNVPNYATPHPMSNGRLVGPGLSYTTIIGLSLSDAHTTPNVSGCLFKSLAFQDWGVDVALGSGAFCETFENCTFTTSSGAGTTYSVVMESAATNAGERNVFRGCWWYNRAYCIDNLSAAADLYFSECSFDGHVTAISNTGGTSVECVSCHFEGAYGSLAANWFYCSGVNSTITFKGGSWNVDGNISGAFPLGQSSSSCGGISIDEVKMGFGATSYTASDGAYGPVLIGGSGRVRCRNPAWGQGTPIKPGISAALNVLAYPGFESASYTDEWTLTNSARSTAVAHTGTYSLALNASSGNNATAVASARCDPGQWATGSFWYQWPGTISGTLQASLSYCDANGSAISGASSAFLTSTTVQGSWTNVTFPSAGTPTPAPPGTVSVKLTVTVFSATGTSIAYIDDVLFTVA